jgi:hypothetical protein
MGRKPGSKDKKPHTHRPATVAEKEKRAEKKQKQSHSDHQRAKANFFMSYLSLYDIMTHSHFDT